MTIHSPKMFLLTFSFANFETTRGSRGKANISFLYNYLMIKVNYTAQKKLLLNFQNLQMEKRGETLFGECNYIGSAKNVLQVLLMPAHNKIDFKSVSRCS